MSSKKTPTIDFQYLMSVGEELLNEGVILKVTAGGLSMFPFLRKGDVVYIKKQKKEDYKKGDIVVFKTAEKFIAHRLIYLKKEENRIMVICKGDSLLKYDKAFPVSQILGKVISIKRNNKKVDYMSDHRGRNAKIIADLSPYLVPFYWTGWIVYKIIRKVSRWYYLFLH